MDGRRNGSRRNSDLNIMMIPATLITGVISWFLCNMLYSNMVGQIPRPIVIAIIFAILYALLLLVVVLVSIVQHEYQGNIITLLLMLLPGTLAVFVVSALFQFLYELNPGYKSTGPSSYIFIIDDSGSTIDTDPEQLRYKAVEDVLSGEDASMPYMIYSFSDSTNIVREMGPAVNGEHFSSESNGGTSIRGALETAINDFRNGTWDGGDSPKFVLLTDGIATDIDIFHSVNPVLNEYVDENLSISTVGLGDADDELMEKIANKTGGVYISVSEAADLSNAMKKAAVSNSGRDLVSNRYMRKLNGLYGFLRVIFLTLIGTMMGTFIAYAYGNPESYFISIIASVVLSLIGALLMELLTGVAHINHKPVWLILWAFLAVTIVLKRYIRGMKTVLLDGTNSGYIDY